MPLDPGDADRLVRLTRLRVGEEVEPDALSHLGEGVAEDRPAPRVGIPVVGPEVGADPDVGLARLVGVDIFARCREHRRQVAGGSRRAGLGVGEQAVELVQLAWFAPGAIDQHQPRLADRPERFHELTLRGVELRRALSLPRLAACWATGRG